MDSGNGIPVKIPHGRKALFSSALSFLLCLVFLLSPLRAHADETTAESKSGKISGVVYDAKTGEKMVGVTVLVQKPAADSLAAAISAAAMGAKTDLNGQYLVKAVPPGIYTITVSMLGYAKTVVSDVEVTKDGIAKLDVGLKTENVQLKDVIKVSAQREKGTTSANDAIRANAPAAMDLFSAEQIGRAGVSDAQGALSKVTGVSLLGDQAYVRGVSDRYLSVQMNGSTMPSSDPDKQTFRTDIVASNMIESITVQKTYTPDQPGNFTGAAINITTKNYPESRRLVLNGGLGYNNEVTNKKNFMTAPGSTTDKWGYDNGYRDMPDIVKNNAFGGFPSKTQPLGFHAADAHFYEAVQAALHTDVAPDKKTAPYNGNTGIEYGDNLTLFGRRLGVVGTFSYNHIYTYYEGLEQKYEASQGTSGAAASLFKGGADYTAKDKVMWGGSGNVSYSPITNQEFTFRYVRNQEGEQKIQYFPNFYSQLSSSHPNFYRISSIKYTERSLESYQIQGDHLFALTESNKGIRANWTWTTSKASENTPDLRAFSDFASVQPAYDSLGNEYMDTTIVPQSSGSSALNRRVWRYLDETVHEGKVDVTVPILDELKFKTGMGRMHKDRDRAEYALELMNASVNYTNVDGSNVYYDADWEQYIDATGGIVGIRKIDSTKFDADSNRIYDTLFRLGPFYADNSDKQNNYTGDQKVTSWYGMFDFAPFSWLKIITGARFERTDMHVNAVYDGTIVQLVDDTARHVDAGDEIGSIRQNDWLPSLNLIFGLTSKMNVRAAYSRTLARPSLREFSPARSFDMARGDEFYGNPNLKRTFINNMDLRWEWFTRPGEIISISGFYKRFKDPIEIGFVGSGASVALQPQNSSTGKLYGAEIELRKNLGFLQQQLRPLSVGANFTFTRSKVDLTEAEQVEYASIGLDPERPLQGQPPYVVNLDVGYQNSHGSRASIIYNIVGDQLFINTDGRRPDVYEKHRSMIDLSFSQSIAYGMTVKLTAKNILDKEVVRYYKVPGGILVEDLSGNFVKDALATYESYPLGRTFGMSLNWQVW